MSEEDTIAFLGEALALRGLYMAAAAECNRSMDTYALTERDSATRAIARTRVVAWSNIAGEYERLIRSLVDPLKAEVLPDELLHFKVA